MRLRFAAVLLVLSLIGGCVSAERAYHDGMDQEVSGDYASAANAYALALERDPDLPNVRGRLAVAGREAVAQWLASAPPRGPVGGADAYLAADALVTRASRLGVDLARPASFDADRDAALRDAVATLHLRADDAARAGDFAGALQTLGRARAYRPSPQMQAALDVSARRATAGWAEADYAAGRFRAAYGRAQTALGMYAPDDPAAGPVIDLLDDIVAAGTLVAAVFPSESDEALPRGLLRDFDDVLVDDELTALPPLLALVDPAEVRRQSRRAEGGVRTPVRQAGGRDLIDHPRRTARFADDLGADFGVAVELGPLAEARTEGEPRTETARLREGGARATYQRRRVSLERTLGAAFVVVDAASRQVVCEDEVRVSATERYDRASYDGDWRALDLSRRERALFTDDADEDAADRLLDQLRDEAAAALAAKVVSCLERQVP